jgi:hypothetical protein
MTKISSNFSLLTAVASAKILRSQFELNIYFLLSYIYQSYLYGDTCMHVEVSRKTVFTFTY